MQQQKGVVSEQQQNQAWIAMWDLLLRDEEDTADEPDGQPATKA
jgi:hypothetical protein